MYRVIDPAGSKIHPLFLPRAAVCLLVKATRLRQSEPWQAPVQQSMYLGAWEESGLPPPGKPSPQTEPWPPPRSGIACARSGMACRIRGDLAGADFQFRRQNSLANRRAFVPLRPDFDLLKSDSF